MAPRSTRLMTHMDPALLDQSGRVALKAIEAGELLGIPMDTLAPTMISAGVNATARALGAAWTVDFFLNLAEGLVAEGAGEPEERL